MPCFILQLINNNDNKMTITQFFYFTVSFDAKSYNVKPYTGHTHFRGTKID